MNNLQPNNLQDSLLGTDDITPGTQQWRLNRIHLINWGGFHGGPHTVDINGHTTLIGGGTGSGKSSLLDAWTAVLQPPHTTALNAASNDVTGVRAPGARNALTYLRGKTGETEHPTSHHNHDIVLREGTVWGAISLEFTSTAGGIITIGRLMFATENTTRPTDLTNRWFSIRKRIPLDRFHPYATPTNTFHARRMRTDMPGLEIYNTYKQAVEEAFMPALGIGRGGDGKKALDLLHDIQRAAPVTSINALFRDRVLERPTTYERFDAGLHEFDTLTRSHTEFTSIVQQIELLRPITERKKALDTAQHNAHQVTSFGNLHGGESTFEYWKATTWVNILDAADDDLTNRRNTLRTAEKNADTRAHDLTTQAENLRHDWETHGGGDLDRLRREAHTTRRELERIHDRRTRAATTTGLGNNLPTTRDTWENATTHARTFEHTAQTHLTQLRENANTALLTSAAKDEEVTDLAAQIAGHELRAGNIEDNLDRIRLHLAETAGMTRDQLPFVAELLDMAPGEENWRHAADSALGGFATTLLIPRDQRAHFNRAIDGITTPRRIQFRSVDPDLPTTRNPHPNSLASKLITKPGHPYAGWLGQRIDDTYTHICVETADELTDDNTPRITRAGQERHGDRGAIGGNRMPIIGFLNEARLTVLREQLATATNNADIARAAHAEADRALENFRTQRRQHKALLDLTWEDLDPTPTQQRLDNLTERITTIENGSSSLTEIDQRYRDCLNAADAAKKEAGSLAAQRRTIENDIENISELKDHWLTATEKQERAGQTLTDEQRNYLDELLAADGPNARERDQFENATNRIRRTLTEARTRAEEEAERARADLLRIFSDYLSKWPNNNLAPELEAYPDFLDILHRLDAHGVEERRRAWAAQIMQWIGEHIYAMIREFQIASDAIEERLTPIQTVLDTLPFSIRANRLRIRANYAPASEVPRFQKQLRALAENMTATTDTLDDEALVAFAEAQFARATHLLAQVREKTPAGADNRVRDQLLDVRTHHIFSADEVDAEGNVVMNYNNIAGKSGGESQELIAFITGAALRYQLGDDNRARPVFAPVILDEAFIKADSMTSHRGAEAWPRLGFQPIVVAPEGSFNALEPHFDQLVAVTKDPEGHSTIHMLTDAERAHVREGE